MSKTKIKIFGAAHCGNVGDDLIARILVGYLEKWFGDAAEVSLIPQQKQHEQIKDADILIIGGGGLIYDYDINNVKNYCEAIEYAHNYRIPVYFMGMGVQHVFSEEARKLYGAELPKVSAIATRGTHDSEFIVADLGYTASRVVTSRDLVFLYDKVIGARPRPVRSSKKPVLSLSLADWQLGKNYQHIQPGLADQYKSYREYLEANVSTLKKKFDVKVVCQAREDKKISKYLAEVFETEVVEFSTLEESTQLIEVYRASDYVITNRYHGLIAAIIARTPAVGVSFSTHKSQRLIDDSFPSLRSQFYTVSDFVEGDFVAKLMGDDFLATLQTAKESEYAACIRETEKHDEILKYIAADIAKQ
jgi:polysaccharide pyruvyl transferase WcaK-like protein